MNKLEERFKKCIYDTSNVHLQYKSCAEECKTISIKYREWVSNMSILIGRQSGNEARSNAWIAMSDEDMFDMFMEEYYGH